MLRHGFKAHRRAPSAGNILKLGIFSIFAKFGACRVLKLGIFDIFANFWGSTCPETWHFGRFFQVLGDVGAGSGVDGASPEVFGAGQAFLRRRSSHFASQVRSFCVAGPCFLEATEKVPLFEIVRFFIRTPLRDAFTNTRFSARIIWVQGVFQWPRFWAELRRKSLTQSV